MISVMGWPPGYKLTYERWFGLMLNLPRLMMRPAYTTAVGVEAASGTGELDIDIFDSITDSADKADELMVNSNHIRETRKIIANHRGNRR